MNNYPMNQLGQPVMVGDTVALTTTSGKNVRTRVARVVNIVQGQPRTRWDYQNRISIPTGEYDYTVSVRLFHKKRKWDVNTQTWSDPTYQAYVKRVYGIRDSLPIDPDTLPAEIQEVLNGKRN